MRITALNQQKQTACSPFSRRALLFTNFICVLLLIGADCLTEYATDSYTTFVTSMWKHMMVDNGRIISGAVYYVFENLLRLSPGTVYLISYTASVVFLTLALYVVSRRIQNATHSLLWTVLLSVGLIANVFLIELFLFIEKGLFMLGILLVALAFDRTAQFLEDGCCRHLLSAAAALIAAVFIYQTLPGLYVVLCLPFILQNASNLKQFFKNNVVVALLYAVSMGLGLLVTKFIFASIRLGDDTSILSAFAESIRQLKGILLYSAHVAPTGYLALCIFAAGVVILAVSIRTKSVLPILHAAYITAGVLFTSLLPYWLGSTADYTPRVLFPLASLPAILILDVLLCSNASDWRVWKKDLFSFALILVFLIQMFSFQKIFIQRYQCNQADRLLCEIIQERISEYEQTSGTKVKKICVYPDADPVLSYPGLNSSQLIFSSLDMEWSDVSSISFYSGVKYKRGKQDARYRAFFAERNWNNYSDEQLVFEEDTLHLCVY